MPGKTMSLELAYSPLEKQKVAHALPTKYRGFCGGWGNGKTSWGCVETFILLQEFPGTTAIIARKTRPELRSTTWDMFLNGDPSQPTSWHGLPRETIASYNKTEMYLELRTSIPGVYSRVHGLPLDDPKKIENYNLGLFWIDQAEEVDEEIFLKFHGRLRQIAGPRQGLLTFNPNGHNWLWRRFIDPARPPTSRRQYSCVEATTYDNPNLPDDYIDQFAGLPEVWIQRFIMGSHEVFVGQIFTDYNPEVHVVQPFRIPSQWQRSMSIDPGIRHEGAVSWCARDPDGNVYYYREHLEANRDVYWWSQLIRAYEGRADWGGPDEHIPWRYIGPESRQRSQTDGRTVYDLFWENGIFVEVADRDPVARISRITEYLRPQEDRRSPWSGESPAPRLYIFADCEKMLEYLPQYRWRPQRMTYAEDDSPEKPRKKDDHNIDNLGHLLLAYDRLPTVDGDTPYLTPDQRVVAELVDAAYEQAQTSTNIEPGLGVLRARAGYHDVLGGF